MMEAAKEQGTSDIPTRCVTRIQTIMGPDGKPHGVAKTSYCASSRDLSGGNINVLDLLLSDWEHSPAGNGQTPTDKTSFALPGLISERSRIPSMLDVGPSDESFAKAAGFFGERERDNVYEDEYGYDYEDEYDFEDQDDDEDAEEREEDLNILHGVNAVSQLFNIQGSDQAYASKQPVEEDASMQQLIKTIDALTPHDITEYESTPQKVQPAAPEGAVAEIESNQN